MNISIGKLRGIQQISDSNGFLTICAIDHRESLRKALSENGQAEVTCRNMVDFKLDLCRAVAGLASGVLLDPQYGAPHAIAAAVLSGDAGLLVSLEKTGYSTEGMARLNELLPGWNVRKAKRMGASAVKLLIYFRPDLKEAARKQMDLVTRLADACLAEDIPLLVEPVTYPVESEVGNQERFAAMRPELVIETARQITGLPVDILKVEFPADINREEDENKLLEYCRELDRASSKPWVLLSAGAGFDLFKKQVKIASTAGASGFLAGRALWQEGTRIKSSEGRWNFFADTVRKRVKELTELVHLHGKPWYARYGSKKGEFDAIAENWFLNYPEN